MCNLKCSVATVILGVILVIGSCCLAFIVVPILVRNIIFSETVLLDDTIQMERFETVPFPMSFSIRMFNISNTEQILSGAVPVVTEVGPYVYKLYQMRNITGIDEDLIRYTRTEHFEFDADASYPYTEDDLVTVVNVPYHAIIQIAEMSFPQLASILNLAMGDVFGEFNSPIMTVKVRSLLFEGVRICENPGLIGRVACSIIRELGEDAQNLVEQEDGSLLFSLLSYKHGIPSPEYEAIRGIDDPKQLGALTTFDSLDHFMYWADEEIGVSSVCNKINGTDSGIFAPFVDRESSLYAINTDICRSIELRFQHENEVEGIPTLKFSANEWFLANEDGCFCLNVTSGINREDGCLLEGAMELYTCVGAMLVLTYPHFLYADAQYRNGVLGIAPNEDKHKIFLDVEPNTGTPIAGAKRAQFNIFLRPISGISATLSLRTTLTPIVWFEESFMLPAPLREEIRDRLLGPLNLLDIVLPVIIALCVLVLLGGIGCVVRAKRTYNKPATTIHTTTTSDDIKT